MENVLHSSNKILNQNTSKEMSWLKTVVPNVEMEEADDIVERFTCMSNVKRNNNRKADREEIRRRLAMGSDNDEYYNGERIHRKPSLQSRLQSGMNLQICFMNETSSDTESLNSDQDVSCKSMNNLKLYNGEKYVKRPDSLFISRRQNDGESPKYIKQLTNISKPSTRDANGFKQILLSQSDFLSCQAQLQAEARVALLQAKEMAHMQMELERQNAKMSPISDMIKKTLEKVGICYPADRRRLSRQILTEMSVPQLQIIANDLHSKIEYLNEKLVRYLIGRDDLHMEQDSMLVDIEDLTRYIDANRC